MKKTTDMNVMRVCAITCDRYPEDPLVRRTAEAAVSQDCEYHIICSLADGLAKEEVFRGVYIHRIRIRDRHGRSIGRITAMGLGAMLFYWSLYAIKASIKLARLHFKHKFDIVHVHNIPDFLVFAAVVPKLFGARVILHIQDVTPELMAVKASGRIRRRVTVALAKIQERISTIFADHVITVGWPFEKALLARGVPPEKLSSILNSADPGIFTPSKRTEPFLGEATRERPLILMYHGTCARRNGVDTAIKAFAKARQTAPHLVFHIRGVGEAVPSLKQLAHELGVADHVVFSGYGPLEEVADFVVHGDIGIIAYPCDGFMNLVLPTKAYEYSWMRRPMIAASTSAIRSMFRPTSLRLCKASDADSFAEAIIELYRHPEKRAELVASAWEDYYYTFRWELIAERYRALLRSLASHQPVKTTETLPEHPSKQTACELVQTKIVTDGARSSH